MDVVEDQGAPGVVEGNAEYAVVQGVFATGFSVPGRTIPGFAVRCDLKSIFWFLKFLGFFFTPKWLAGVTRSM